jgi:hypothetical protein
VLAERLVTPAAIDRLVDAELDQLEQTAAASAAFGSLGAPHASAAHETAAAHSAPLTASAAHETAAAHSAPLTASAAHETAAAHSARLTVDAAGHVSSSNYHSRAAFGGGARDRHDHGGVQAMRGSETAGNNGRESPAARRSEERALPTTMHQRPAG